MRKLIPINRHKEWIEDGERKLRIRQKVARAVKLGRLVRSGCVDCGDATVKTEGHHEDYDKPLDVIWLCKKCHAKRHAGARPKGKSIKQGVYYYYET